MSPANVIDRIKRVAMEILPEHSKLYLYGSRARGDAREDSDWDLLILLDKPKISLDDYGVAYPFREAGWEMGEEINPQVYSQKEWHHYSFTPFYKNVEHDKQVLL
ncbi:MAG: nucleotidyltransferase domain-containing protein [Bacteroidaceae bacterium]|nr:nucleotidyltransferase domain-containing protein [Bacteroidaceae bacterium]